MKNFEPNQHAGTPASDLVGAVTLRLTRDSEGHIATNITTEMNETLTPHAITQVAGALSIVAASLLRHTLPQVIDEMRQKITSESIKNN